MDGVILLSSQYLMNNQRRFFKMKLRFQLTTAVGKQSYSYVQVPELNWGKWTSINDSIFRLDPSKIQKMKNTQKENVQKNILRQRRVVYVWEFFLPTDDVKTPTLYRINIVKNSLIEFCDSALRLLWIQYVNIVQHMDDNR